MNLQASGLKDKGWLRRQCDAINLRVNQPAHRVSHLVVALPPRRTLKLLYALANGAWVVSEQWLTDSVAHGGPLPPDEEVDTHRGQGPGGALRMRALPVQSRSRFMFTVYCTYRNSLAQA